MPVFECWDRGLLLEDSWEQIACGSSGSDGPTLLGLREDIANGLLPAPIMTSTVMETGRRVMLTPVDFRDVPRNASQVTRNEILLARTLQAWEARFRQEGLGVCFETIALRPPAGTPDGPLSWHLTPKQIEEIEKAVEKALWPPDLPEKNSLEGMREFLENEGCG